MRASQLAVEPRAPETLKPYPGNARAHSPKQIRQRAASMKRFECLSLDASRRDGLILDPFGGSGTTLLAAEQTGRRARLLELDPLYCDVIIRRFMAATGTVVTDASGQSFAARAAAATRQETDND